MDLNHLWFILIAVLFTGFLFLEGFDYGVGILLPILGKNDTERRMIINSIGPVWDGNEVWLLTAGGAMFAAFPNWYATLFSGFYLALVLVLVSLILRGVAFEFRSKDERLGWRQFWDGAIFVGSLLSAILWGVALANIVRGVPIGDNMQYVGTFGDLLNPFALVGGLVTLALFTMHGATFLALKVDEPIAARARSMAKRALLALIGVAVVFVLLAAAQTDVFNKVTGLGLIVAAGLMLLNVLLTNQNRFGLAFVVNGLMVVMIVVALFGGLFPRVLPSTLGAQFDLTIYNASSSQYTLSVMTVIALTFVPIVLAYQAWTYWVFRKRLTTKSHLEY